VVSRCLRTAEDYELAAYEFAVELAQQNCRYPKVGFTPSFHSRKGVADATFLRGLLRARDRARETLGVEIAWVFDILAAVLRLGHSRARHRVGHFWAAILVEIPPKSASTPATPRSSSRSSGPR
jgi:hypothetical protein